MLIRRIPFGGKIYAVFYDVTPGMKEDPWGFEPGSPDEVSICEIRPRAYREVWAYMQGYLEAELEDDGRQDVRDDYYEECKADAQRTGRL